MCLVTLVLVFVSGCVPLSVDSQDASNLVPISEQRQINFNDTSIIDIVIGGPVEDAMFFMPSGVHTRAKRLRVTNHNMVGVIHNSIVYGTFTNSFDDQTYVVGFARNIYSSGNFGLDYYAGVMHGYKGFFYDVSHIPLHNTFLFKGNLNPAVAIVPYYNVTDEFAVQALYAPGMLIVGTKFEF